VAHGAPRSRQGWQRTRPAIGRWRGRGGSISARFLAVWRLAIALKSLGGYGHGAVRVLEEMSRQSWRASRCLGGRERSEMVRGWC
jgi:hypothetical protein